MRIGNASGESRKKLRPNHRRILEAILYLITEAERRGGYVTEYDIDKAVFIADVAHLNQHGRPITFDNFVAMKDGPVPSATRDVLQSTFDHKRYYEEAWPPWDRVPSPRDGKRAFKFVRPRRQPNLRVLSASDISALSEALGIVKSLRFGGTRDYTHEHPAYKQAWKGLGEKKLTKWTTRCFSKLRRMRMQLMILYIRPTMPECSRPET